MRGETIADVSGETIAGRPIPGGNQPRWFLAAFIIAWTGAYLAMNAVSMAAIPRVLAVVHPADKERLASIVVALGGLVTIAVTPLFGQWSDRTRSRHGMRRPWMAGGLVVAVAGLALLAVTTAVPLIAAGWMVVQAGLGATVMAQHALLADQIPARIRARVSAAVSVAGGLATLAGAVIVGVLPAGAQPAWFLVPGLLGCVLCLPLLGMRDLVLGRDVPDPAPFDARALAATYWLSPRRHPDFAWAWACRMLITMSIFIVQIYLYFYLIDRLGRTVEEASALLPAVLGVFMLAGIPTSLVFGWVSDRTGRRKGIVWVSCLATVAGLVLALAAPNLGVWFVAIALLGCAQGSFVSVDIALMTEVLPSFASAGKDLGIVSLSYLVPQLLAPALGYVLLGLGGGGNYEAVFAASIAMAVAGGLAVRRVRAVR